MRSLFLFSLCCACLFSPIFVYGEENDEPNHSSINMRLQELGYETWDSPRDVSEVGLPIAAGFAQPYSYKNLMRAFSANRCRHRGLDIGGVGQKDGGIGTIINAAHRSEITFIGRSASDSKEFGRLDKRKGHVTRRGKKYPRQIKVPGYGIVYPFTRNYGRWRSGTVLVTKIIGGPLDGHILRYMHLAEIRPDLKIGDIVEAGEHIALMGGSAVQDSGPHLHIDLETPEKVRVDLALYIGLPDTGKDCKKSTKSTKTDKKKTSSKTSSKKSSTKKKKTTEKSSKKSDKKHVPTTERETYRSQTPLEEKPQKRELEREKKEK